MAQLVGSTRAPNCIIHNEKSDTPIGCHVSKLCIFESPKVTLAHSFSSVFSGSHLEKKLSGVKCLCFVSHFKF